MHQLSTLEPEVVNMARGLPRSDGNTYESRDGEELMARAISRSTLAHVAHLAASCVTLVCATHLSS